MLKRASTTLWCKDFVCYSTYVLEDTLYTIEILYTLAAALSHSMSEFPDTLASVQDRAATTSSPVYLAFATPFARVKDAGSRIHSADLFPRNVARTSKGNEGISISILHARSREFEFSSSPG
jgi:hypothetical protein